MRRSVLPASKRTARTGGRAGDPGRFMGPGCPALIIMRPPMSTAFLRLATTAWADHGGPLRAEGLSPLMVGLLAGAPPPPPGALILGTLTPLTRTPRAPPPTPQCPPSLS